MGISAGAGGQDAQDWAAMLQRMYERYCEKKGWRVEAIHRSFGEPGAEGRIGVKQASFQASGPFAYGLLKRETGVHRLVRMSPFSAKQLRHTSFAAVEVTPEVDVKQEKDIEIKPEDVRVEFFNASGPGGQNVNKRSTAVRVTHVPTNIVVFSQTERSQPQNKEIAMEILRAKLYEIKREREMNQLSQERQSQIGTADRSEKIRTYNYPQNRVTDHRINKSWHDLETIMNGKLDAIVKTFRKTET